MSGEFKKAELNQIVWWQGELHEVFALGDGRAVELRPVSKPPCPTCGSDHRVDLLEHSPLFQDGVSPVATINGPLQPHPAAVNPQDPSADTPGGDQ